MFTLKKANIKEVKLIKAVYEEAFPLKERKPFCTIKKGVKSGKLELMLAINDEKVIGFGTCFVYKDIVYLDYLAMAYQVRGHGYGSIFLNELFKYYKDKRLVLIMERVDEPCSNKEQRIKRKAFYLDNGMSETGLFTNAVSGHYEILIHNGTITGPEFIDAMNYSLGKFFAKLAKYHIVK